MGGYVLEGAFACAFSQVGRGGPPVRPWHEPAEVLPFSGLAAEYPEDEDTEPDDQTDDEVPLWICR